jgi:hypothetical protein
MLRTYKQNLKYSSTILLQIVHKNVHKLYDRIILQNTNMNCTDYNLDKRFNTYLLR